MLLDAGRRPARSAENFKILEAETLLIGQKGEVRQVKAPKLFFFKPESGSLYSVFSFFVAAGGVLGFVSLSKTVDYYRKS